MIYDYSSYSIYLKATLAARQAANSAYSLRAMAMALGVSASTLSDVINGKKNFSEQTGNEVGIKLKLTSKKLKYFNTLVQLELTKNEELKILLLSQLKALNPKLREHFEVNVDQFKFMSDWYFSTILELTYLTHIKISAESLVQCLNITSTQAKEALEILQRLELLEPTLDGESFQKTKKQFKFQAGSPSKALRKYHLQMLTKAQESIETQTPEEKLIGSETIPLNVEDLGEANDIIESCFQQILELSKRSQNRSHVYHLGIQFFQTSKNISAGQKR